jgi:hypothetical protein
MKPRRVHARNARRGADRRENRRAREIAVTREDWTKRYVARMLERCPGVSLVDAEFFAGIGFDLHLDGDEGTPEDSAEDEMANWTE